MKNIRITTKLQVLTLIMIISTALIGGVGYLSLTQLQGAVDQLAGTTVKKLLATESAQKQTLIAIRGQKNAVLATTDTQHMVLLITNVLSHILLNTY